MENSSEYIGILVSLVLAVGIALLMLGLNKILGPKNKMSAVKSEAFECGMPPMSAPTGQLSIKFYLMAMLFILFDVEVVWFFPWAVILRELGWAGIVEMFLFAGFLALAYVYAWKKGALEWEK